MKVILEFDLTEGGEAEELRYKHSANGEKYAKIIKTIIRNVDEWIADDIEEIKTQDLRQLIIQLKAAL